MTPAGTTARLFNKTELFITGLELSGVDLGGVAQTVARVLGVDQDKILVVDARASLITLDILQPEIDLQKVIGREKELLAALARIPGLKVTQSTAVHSEGVLGLISLEGEPDDDLPARLARMDSMIAQRVSQRCLVLPTGDEIIAGNIVDTNTAHLVQTMKRAGFSAEAGPALPDDQDVVVGRMLEAAMRGYGLVLTTGGTGAETKDCVVEAIEQLDPEAATPYTVHYTKGQGRHHKDGVRIGVGRVDLTTFVALTGPHEEVLQVTPTLVKGLQEQWNQAKLANALAEILRANYHHS